MLGGHRAALVHVGAQALGVRAAAVALGDPLQVGAGARPGVGLADAVDDERQQQEPHEDDERGDAEHPGDGGVGGDAEGGEGVVGRGHDGGEGVLERGER